MDTEAGSFDDDEGPRRPLLPPEDRIWRHPSELGAVHSPGAGASSRVLGTHPRQFVSSILVAGAIGVASLVIVLRQQSGPRTLGEGRFHVSVAAASPISTVLESVTTTATTELAIVPSTVATTVAHRVTATALAVTTASSVAITVQAASVPDSPMLAWPGAPRPIPVVAVLGRYLLGHLDAAPGSNTLTVTLPDGSTRSARLVAFSPMLELVVAEADGPVPTTTLDTSRGLAVGDTVRVGTNRGVVTSDHGDVAHDGHPFEHGVTVSVPGAQPGDLVWSGSTLAGFVVRAEPDRATVLPTSLAAAAVASMVRTGTVNLAWLGVSGHDDGGAPAIVVDAIEPNSPAATIGIVVGDRIATIGGHEITDGLELVAAVWACEPGSATTIGIVRGGHELQLTGTLGAMPADS